MPVTKDEGTYVDTGTGAVQNPGEPTEHTQALGNEVDLETNKGVVPLKKGEPHSYTQDADDLGPPTGVSTIPDPEPVYQHPHPKVKAVQEAENKAVHKAKK